MSIISMEALKEIRQRTGASISLCKKALDSSDGKIDGALQFLKEQANIRASKVVNRETSEGRISVYNHATGKLSVLVDIRCETDFAAKTGDFKNFCENVALHIAATNPKYVNREEIVDEDYDLKAKEIREEMTTEQDSEEYFDKQFEEWYKEICLLEQVYVLDNTITIEKLRQEISSRLGENVVIKRFVRWQI